MAKRTFSGLIILSALAFAIILSLSITTSAYTDCYPSMDGYEYRGTGSYYESPGFTIFPTEKTSQSANSNYLDENFDSSSYAYDYRGPMFEKTTSFTDDLFIDKSVDDDFFTSDVTDVLHRTIGYKTTEKYVGASESLYINSQNRRTSTGSSNSASNTDYNGGMNWGKLRTFDSDEYADMGNYEDYYYRPLYDSSTGGYNWRY